MRGQARLLPDGRRLHLHDGPIDLVVEAFGGVVERRAAYAAATRRFATVLDELCAELPALRAPARSDGFGPKSPVGRRMVAAVALFADRCFVTPMAAVAGAVADEVLSAMLRAADLPRAYVNDGGDIAVHLAPGERLDVGIAHAPDGPAPFGRVALEAAMGVATSGRHGRSFSLGIADAVTVLAANAALADAAATLIAGAVDLPGHGSVRRERANAIDPDSDLGGRLVTLDVGPLGRGEVAAALDAGAALAETWRGEGLILGAALALRDDLRLVGGFPALERERGAICA